MPPNHVKDAELRAYIAETKIRHDGVRPVAGAFITLPGYDGYQANHNNVPTVLVSSKNSVWNLLAEDSCESSINRIGAAVEEEIILSKSLLKQARVGESWTSTGNVSGATILHYHCEHDARCTRELKVIRFSSLGILGLYSRGEHDLTVHNLPAENGRGLPVDCKRLVDKFPYMNPESLFVQMEKDEMLSNIDLRRDEVVKRISTKQKEINRSSAKKGALPKATAKYLKERIDAMTVDLDDLLANRGEKLAAKIDQYKESKDYLDLVWIIDHDIDDDTGDFNYVIWTSPKLLLLGNTIQQSGRGTGLIQLESDMTDDLYKVDSGQGISKWKVGTVGVSDSAFRYWDAFDGVFRTEDGETVTKLFIPAEKAMIAFDVIVSRVLKDGGSGLEKACLDRAWITRTCLAHAARFPGTRGAGYRGTMGSLIRYLVATLKLPLEVTSAIMSHWLTLRNLPTVTHYQAAREAFIEVWNDVINQHVKDHYVPEYPQTGFAVQLPGQVACTNGLEKTWDWKKRWTADFDRDLPQEPRLLNVLRADGKRTSRFLDKCFQTDANHNRETWEQILQASFRSTPPDDAFAAVYYSLVDGRLLTHTEAVGKSKALGGVVVYRPSIEAHKAMVMEAKRTVASIGGGHSDLHRLRDEFMGAGDSDLRRMSPEVRLEYYRLLGIMISDLDPERKSGQSLREYLKCHAQRNDTVSMLFQFRSMEDKDNAEPSTDFRSISNVEDDAQKAVISELMRQKADDNSSKEDNDEIQACIDEGKGKKSSTRRTKAANIMNEHPERERICRMALGNIRQSFVLPDGAVCCLCNDFHRDQFCRDTALQGLMENKKGCPNHVRRTDTDHFVPDVRDRTLNLHRQEAFSDEDRVKTAYSLLPQLDPLYDKISDIHSVRVPGTKGVNGRPSSFGVKLALSQNKIVIGEVINPVVDLYVGDEVTKINGQSVRNSTTSTIVAIDDATRMLERVSWRETGRGFAVLSVRRHLRKGSPTGGAHGREVHDCRRSNVFQLERIADVDTSIVNAPHGNNALAGDVIGNDKSPNDDDAVADGSECDDGLSPCNTVTGTDAADETIAPVNLTDPEHNEMDIDSGHPSVAEEFAFAVAEPGTGDSNDGLEIVDDDTSSKHADEVIAHDSPKSKRQNETTVVANRLAATSITPSRMPSSPKKKKIAEHDDVSCSSKRKLRSRRNSGGEGLLTGSASGSNATHGEPLNTSSFGRIRRKKTFFDDSPGHN